jgi:hypothetical protein
MIDITSDKVYEAIKGNPVAMGRLLEIEKDTMSEIQALQDQYPWLDMGFLSEELAGPLGIDPGLMRDIIGRAKKIEEDHDRRVREVLKGGGNPAKPKIPPKKNTEKRIYPNDPCPCGSGKKYKNCHGKKGRSAEQTE